MISSSGAANASCYGSPTSPGQRNCPLQSLNCIRATAWPAPERETLDPRHTQKGIWLLLLCEQVGDQTIGSLMSLMSGQPRLPDPACPRRPPQRHRGFAPSWHSDCHAAVGQGASSLGRTTNRAVAMVTSGTAERARRYRARLHRKDNGNGSRTRKRCR